MLTQVQVLNKILSEKDYSIISENNLTKEHFPKYVSEFNFIINHYKKYNQVPDVETFVKNFPSFEIFNVNESTEYLVNELYKERTDNYLANTFNKIRDLIINGKTDEAMNVLSTASTKAYENKKLEAVDILEDISRYDIYVDKTQDFAKYYITTGFKELDASFGGGIDRRNAYFVVSARAGYGKTLVMIKMAAAAAEKGLRVLVFSVGKMTNRIISKLEEKGIVYTIEDVKKV